MAKSSLSHILNITGIPYTNTGDIRVNIKRRRVYLRESTLTNDRRVNLSHIISKEINPIDNIAIVDRNINLPENATTSFAFEPTILSGNSISTFTSQFLLTDIFTSGEATQETTPLFFKHKFTNYNSDNVDFANVVIKNVEILDYTFNPIPNTEYFLDDSVGYLYHNLKSIYNPSNIYLQSYYVKYSAQVSGTVAQSFHELLNSEPVFHEATTEDIDSWGNLLSTSKAYFITTKPAYTGFEVLFPPTASNYGYKELGPERLYIKKPLASNTREPWNIRINNGTIIGSIKTGQSTSSYFKYRIGEFTSQSFNPYYPYKFINSEPAIYLYKNLIKVDRNIVDDIDNGFIINIYIYDTDNETLLYRFTNDQSLVGTVSDGITWEDKILSVNESAGFIEINKQLKETWYYYVDYYTSSKEYDFSLIDFNPLNNLEINKEINYDIYEDDQSLRMHRNGSENLVKRSEMVFQA